MSPSKKPCKERLEILCSYIDLLGNEKTSNEIKAQMITDIKGNYNDLVTFMTYPTFLKKTLPIFLEILVHGEPSTIKITDQQTLRFYILLLINRFPRNETLRLHVPRIFEAVLEVVRCDNEDNAIIALRIIHNLYAKLAPKYDHTTIEIMELIQEFCSQIPDLYPQMIMPIDPTLLTYPPATRMDHLKTWTHFVPYSSTYKDSGTKNQSEVTIMPQSQNSIQVLQELPRLALQLVQLYGRQLHANVDLLIPHVVAVVTMTHNSPKINLLNTKLWREMIRMQARFLAFLGAILPTYHDTVAEFQNELLPTAVESLINIPPRYASERKEMIGAIRLFATPLTAHWLLPVIPELCNERNLVGNGYTTTQTLRPLAYGFLGHLLLGLVDSLQDKAVSAAVQMFAFALVDSTLPHRITMLSCQVLSALAAPAVQVGRYDQLENILRIVVLRIKMATKVKVPSIIDITKCNGNKRDPKVFVSQETPTCSTSSEVTVELAESKSTKDIVERRALIGQLCIGFGTVTAANPPCIGFMGCKSSPGNLKVTLSGIKWAIRSLALFPEGKKGEQAWQAQGLEILERLVSVMCSITLLGQTVAITTTIGYVISELPKNKRSLQLVSKMLLAPSIAYNTADVIMKYINENIIELNDDWDTSVTEMLLDQICSCFSEQSGNAVAERLLVFIQKAICVMYEVREPLPMLSALRSLFRALENRDVPQIRPVLPELLTSLVCACHLPLKKQHRTMILETVLIVPVALTNVLQLLPLLTEAAIMALDEPAEGTVMKGLVLLELFLTRVDREFFMKETRRFLGQMTSGLSRVASSEFPAVRTAAVRILGNIGTAAATISQPLEHHHADEQVTIQTTFMGCQTVMDIPVKEMVEAAAGFLFDHSSDMFTNNHCMEVLKSFLIASIQLDDDLTTIHRLFIHPSFTDRTVRFQHTPFPMYTMANKSVRDVHVRAIAGIIMAGGIEPISLPALRMIMFVSSYYTLMAVAQQTGPCPATNQTVKGRGVDVLTYVDAVIWVLRQGRPEHVKPCLLAWMFVLKAAHSVLGTKERAQHLSLLEYMRQSLITLCYYRPSQRGAILTMKCMFDYMSLMWISNHVDSFLRCLIHVARDSACRLTFGTTDRVQGLFDKLTSALTTAPNIDDKDLADMRAAQASGKQKMARELAYGIIDNDPGARHMAMKMLKQLAERLNMTLLDLLEPHKKILIERLLPRRRMPQQFSADDKIASLEATAFCLQAVPRVYEVDLTNEAHREFVEEVLHLCRSEEGFVSADRERYSVHDGAWWSSCRWGAEAWIKIRVAAVQVLSTLHFLADYQQRIVLGLFELVRCNYPEIQEASCQGLVTFCTKYNFGSIRDLIAIEIKAALSHLLNANFGSGCETEVEPAKTQTINLEEDDESASEKVDDDDIFDATYLQTKSEPSTCTLRAAKLLMQLLPACGATFTLSLAKQIIAGQLAPVNFTMSSAEFLCRRQLVLDSVAMASALQPPDVRTWLYVYCHAVRVRQPAFEAGPSFMRDMIVTLILTNPAAAASHLLAKESLGDPILSSLLIHILRRDDGKPLCERIREGGVKHLTDLLDDCTACPEDPPSEIRYQVIRVVHVLAKQDALWLTGSLPLLTKLRKLWCNEKFHKQYSELSSMPAHQWNCPRLVGEVLLQNYILNPGDVQLIFQLMRGVCSRYAADFTWLTNWLESSVASRPIENRYQQFIEFSNTMVTANRSMRHQAAILGQLILPGLREALQNTPEILTSQPWEAGHLDLNNITNVFMNQLLDVPFSLDDFLHVEILKLAVLLMTRVVNYTHNNKVSVGAAGSSKGLIVPVSDFLHKIVSYGWQSQSEHPSSDPMVKHHGYLLLSTTINRQAMRHRILQQMMQGLLQSYSVEVRSLVLHSLDIAMPQIDHIHNGYKLMHGWLIEIAQNCDEAGPQMTLLLQAIVRCRWFYYKMVPLGIVEFMSVQVPPMSTRSATCQQRTLAVDIIDTLIQWADTCQSEINDRNAPLVEYASPAGPSRSEESELAEARENAQHFKPAFFLNHLLRIGALSSEGPDREFLRQLTDRCIVLIEKVFSLKLTADMSNIKIDWLFSMLLDTRSTQCQTTVLKLMICVSKHSPPCQASFMAAMLHTSSLENAEPAVLVLLHELAVTLYRKIPADLGSEAIIANADWDLINTLINKLISKGISMTALDHGCSLQTLGITLETLNSLTATHPTMIDRFCDHLCCTIGDLASLDGDADFSESDAASDLLVNLLLLVNDRAQTLSAEFRKQFVGCVLLDTVNKTRHASVLLTIIELAKENLTKKTVPTEPDFPEMFAVLAQIAPNITARFADDYNLQNSYLTLVLCVYKDKTMRPATKSRKLLEPAIALGLLNPNHDMRSKFVMLVDSTVRRRIDKRLMNSTNATIWHTLKNWTPYAIELIFSIITTATSSPGVQQKISVSNPEHKMMSFTAMAAMSGRRLEDYCSIVPDLMDCPLLRRGLNPVMPILEAAHEVRSSSLLHSVAQLCHKRPALARDIWRGIVPQLWQALSTELQMEICSLPILATENLPADHVAPVPTGDTIMYEAIMLCDPRPGLHWKLMQYAGKYHNLWHCMALAMEQMAFDDKLAVEDKSVNELNIKEALIRMYASMSETDLMRALQRQCATIPSAKEALLLWQLGSFEEAREMAQQAVDEISTSQSPEEHVNTLDSLSQLWTDCTKELGQWEALMEVTALGSAQDVNLMAECSWRLQEIEELSEIVPDLADNSSRQTDWKIHLYNGYLGLFEDIFDHDRVEECVRLARNACVLDWMRLPAMLSEIHVPLLQQAQLILELEEANGMMLKLQRLPRSPAGCESIARNVRLSLWRWENRTSNPADEFVHVAGVGLLRQVFCATVVRIGTELRNGTDLVDIAAIAYENSAIEMGRVARRRWMPQLCVDMLHSETAAIGWERKRQLLKAMCQMPIDMTEGTDLDPVLLVRKLDLTDLPERSLLDALVLGSEAFRMRGLSEEADSWLQRALSCSGGGKAWACWAEWLEQGAPLDTHSANEVLRCWLAAECSTGFVSRRILAKVIWLVQCCDDSNSTLAHQVEECPGVRLSHWLPWIQQVLHVYAETGGEVFFNLLLKLGGRYPQVVYFALRTLYLSVKATHVRMSTVQDKSLTESKRRADLLAISSRLLASILRQNPVDVSPLELFSSELVMLRDSWSASCMRDLRRIRWQCHNEAYNQLDHVATATASPALCSFIETRMIKRGIKESVFTHPKQNLWMVAANNHLVEEFNKIFNQSTSIGLMQLLMTVDRWISILAQKCEDKEPYLITEKCRFITTFTRFTSVMGMFDEDFSIDVPSSHRVLIHGFLPFVEVLHGRRWFRVLGSDGHLRPFQLVTDCETVELRRQDRVLQALELINEDLDKDRETSRRRLHFAYPRLTSVTQDMQLVAMPLDAVSLLQVYHQMGGNLDEKCVNEFYQQVATQQVSASRTLPNRKARQMFYSLTKAQWANVSLLQWAQRSFNEPSHFWAFRKALTSSLALTLTAEHALHLSQIFADSMLIDRTSGSLFGSALTFDIQQLNSAALVSRPVAFRLTESVAELLGNLHVDGPLMAGMIAISRCLSRPNTAMPTVLRTLLINEVPSNVKADSVALQKCTSDWSAAIVARMTALAQSGGEGSVESLIEGAQNTDNLCLMDPNWLPWL